MTNTIYTNAIKDIYENLLDGIELDHGDIAREIAEGHIEDGDALPKRVQKNKKFMEYVEAAKAAYNEQNINNGQLDGVYEDNYYAITYQISDMYGDRGLIATWAHVQDGEPLDTTAVDECDVKHFEVIVDAASRLYRLAHA